MADKYRRSFEEIEKVASKFWPSELSEIEATLSVIPLLLKTQNQFVSVIGTGAPTLERLFTIVEATDLSANLFVKHLVILADYGGEILQRVSTEFHQLFPDGHLHYLWKGVQRDYKFLALPNKKLSNEALKIDGKHLSEDTTLSDLQKDAIALMLFGSTYNGDGKMTATTLVHCDYGKYIGECYELETFLKQLYLWTSKNLWNPN
jgi:hypothetical protein